MNTIIVYASKYGCTETCAKHLEASLTGPVTLVNINKTNMKAGALDKYDTVILGSSIYIGSVAGKIRAFCKENMDALCRKKVGIFMCSGFPEQADEYAAKNFPPALLKHAVSVKSFGGEARLDKMKAVDKLIMKVVTKGDYGSLQISHENIKNFIQEINGQACQC